MITAFIGFLLGYILCEFWVKWFERKYLGMKFKDLGNYFYEPHEAEPNKAERYIQKIIYTLPLVFILILLIFVIHYFIVIYL